MPRSIETTLRRVLLGAAALGLVLAAAGCQGAAVTATTYTRLSEATIARTADIPMPSRTTLTITGVAETNDGDALALDVPTLESLGLVRYRERDPWLEREIEFTGVLVSELLDRIGAPETAATLHIVALDDYEVDIAIADVRRWPVLLATQSDGRHMEIVDKGPTRIVFPHSTFKDIDELRYKDLWIWQLKTIEVR